MKGKFISKPNSCEGCPLKNVPIKFKIVNMCDKWDPRFKVKYTLSDLGHTICEVVPVEIKA